MTVPRSLLSVLLGIVVGGCGVERVDPAPVAASGTGGASAAGAGGTGAEGGLGGSATGPLGRVFEETPSDGAAVDLPLVRLPEGSATLDGELFALRSCTGANCFRDVAPLAHADAAGNFLFDAALDPPNAADAAAEVNAYYHLERFAERFSALGFPAPDPPLHVIVGFGYDFDGDGEKDEFFAGATEVLGNPGIVMGLVGSRNLAYDPDVFGHELMHIYQAKSAPGLDAFIAPTGLNPLGRATGEGTADYYSCSVMDDPDVGEYSAAGIEAPYLSSLINDASCPDGLVGEPHVDGQILSGALWEIRTRVGAERTDAAVRDTLLGLPRGASWAELTDLLRSALESTTSAGELADIDAILAARGLPTCEPLVHLASGQTRGVWVFSSEELHDPQTGDPLVWAQYPSAIQLAVDVPGGTTKVEVEIEAPEGRIAPGDLVVHVGLGAPVIWAVSDGALTVTSDATFSAASPISVDAPAGTLYLSIASQGGEGAGFVEVRATAQ